MYLFSRLAEVETISQQIELGDFLDDSNADGERMRQIRAYQEDSKKHGGLITVMQGSIVLGMNDSNIYRLVRDGRLDTFEHFGKRLLSADQVVEYAKLNRESGHKGSVIKALWKRAKGSV